jgi:hypothetical protein
MSEAIIPIGPSIAYIPLDNDKVTLVDSGDIAFLSRWRWTTLVNKRDNSFYAQAYDRASKKYIRMNRVLHPTQLPVVDHRNGNTLDNRRCNLRGASVSQNCANRRVIRDGLKGAFPVRSGRFISRIKIQDKCINLGTFDSEEEAHAAYCEAAKNHHKEFARFE